MVQQKSCRTSLTLRCREPNRIRPICWPANIRVERTGTPIDGPIAIRFGTVLSATWPDHCKPGQCNTRWNDETARASSFGSRFRCQLHSYTHKWTQNHGCPGALQYQLRLNCPTYVAGLLWTTRLCWQTAGKNYWINMNCKCTTKIIAKDRWFLKCNICYAISHHRRCE